jgi:hypothetical protein
VHSKKVQADLPRVDVGPDNFVHMTHIDQIVIFVLVSE